MTASSYAVDLAARLIRCRSVTPAEGGALVLLAKELGLLGFDCIWLPFGDGPDRIENLFARRGRVGRILLLLVIPMLCRLVMRAVGATDHLALPKKMASYLAAAQLI